jgi:cell division protein FtsQ
MKKEKSKKFSRAKRIILIILFLWLLLLIAGVVVINVFTVEHVKIEGNELYDESLIKETVLNDEYSWNSLYVLIKYKFTETDEIPFVDTMEISMENPHTLRIRVYEKGLLGYVKISSVGENAYFDKDGIVTETSTRVIEGVPLIKGLECEKVVLYDKLPVENKQLKQLLTLTQTLKRNDLIPDSISYASEYAPVLYYGDIRVQLGSMENLTQKVARVKQILPQLENERGTLHLENWTEENKDIVFQREE